MGGGGKTNRRCEKNDPSRVRRFNRQLLESLFPKLIVPHGFEPPRGGVPLGAGMGDARRGGGRGFVADRRDRHVRRFAAHRDCIAYGQSDDRYGGVRLVFVSKSLYQQIVEATGKASQKRVKQIAKERTAATTFTHEPAGLATVEHQRAVRRVRPDPGAEVDADRSRPLHALRQVRRGMRREPHARLVRLAADSGQRRPADGRSRLFLDGPRVQLFDNDKIKNYLVPATCRQCKDPVCLIGCPVGSIHKGDNGQIVIEDWCIGCSRMCRSTVPMARFRCTRSASFHARARAGRHHLPGSATDGKFDTPTPIRHDRDFVAMYEPDASIEFFHAFDLTRAEAARSKAFLLNIESAAKDVTAMINGKAIELKKLDAKEAKQKGWNYEAMLSHVNEKTPEMLRAKRLRKRSCVRERMKSRSA